MCIKLRNITYIDKYIYCMALSLEQPFTTTELLKVIPIKYSSWNIKFIKTKCKKFKKQKMIKQIGYLNNTKYQFICKNTRPQPCFFFLFSCISCLQYLLRNRIPSRSQLSKQPPVPLFHLPDF